MAPCHPINSVKELKEAHINNANHQLSCAKETPHPSQWLFDASAQATCTSTVIQNTSFISYISIIQKTICLTDK